MDALSSTEGQSDLPRYFAQTFRISCGLERGRLDFVLEDGRRFRAEGSAPAMSPRSGYMTPISLPG